VLTLRATSPRAVPQRRRGRIRLGKRRTAAGSTQGRKDAKTQRTAHSTRIPRTTRIARTTQRRRGAENGPGLCKRRTGASDTAFERALRPWRGGCPWYGHPPTSSHGGFGVLASARPFPPPTHTPPPVCPYPFARRSASPKWRTGGWHPPVRSWGIDADPAVPPGSAAVTQYVDISRCSFLAQRRMQAVPGQELLVRRQIKRTRVN